MGKHKWDKSKKITYKLADVLSAKVVTDHKTTEKDRGIGHWKYKKHCPWIFTNATFFFFFFSERMPLHCYA